jgi:hypothetical protein
LQLNARWGGSEATMDAQHFGAMFVVPSLLQVVTNTT